MDGAIHTSRVGRRAPLASPGLSFFIQVKVEGKGKEAERRKKGKRCRAHRKEGLQHIRRVEHLSADTELSEKTRPPRARAQESQ